MAAWLASACSKPALRSWLIVRPGRAVINARWQMVGPSREVVRSKLAFWFSLATVTK
ncbi:hypothetical protein D3C71_2085930 [compost metagenome]